MNMYNDQTPIFSILTEINDGYLHLIEDNPYIYKILRSYNNGLSWSHLATMKASDLEEAHDIVDLLNIGAKSIEQKNKLTNIFGNKIRNLPQEFPHNHSINPVTDQLKDTEMPWTEV